MKTLDDIPAGQSWATRFRTVTFIDAQGVPVRPAHLAPGDVHPGTPAPYQGVGVIKIRDRHNRRVTLVDSKCYLEFTVSYDDCWDWDQVEWIEHD